MIFTSGTTGAPKGIEVSWRKLYDVGVVSTSILNYGPDDVGYICMPLNHSNSLYLNLMPALLNGARVLLRRRFSASRFLPDIEISGATIWNSVGDPVSYVLSTENDWPLYVLEAANPRDFSPAGFVAFCKEKLPPYAWPAFVRLVRELPMTETQKVRKAVLLGDFIERTPELDKSDQDILYRIGPDGGAFRLRLPHRGFRGLPGD